MEFLGIGPLELLFIFLILLIVLGPRDMVKAGQTIGRFLRRLMLSDTWRTVQETSRRIRYLPNTLVRQAGLEELQDDLKRQMDLPEVNLKEQAGGLPGSLSAWTRPAEPPADLAPKPDEPTSETAQADTGDDNDSSSGGNPD